MVISGLDIIRISMLVVMVSLPGGDNVMERRAVLICRSDSKNQQEERKCFFHYTSK
jgi:hypothetical protein